MKLSKRGAAEPGTYLLLLKFQPKQYFEQLEQDFELKKARAQEGGQLTLSARSLLSQPRPETIGHPLRFRTSMSRCEWPPHETGHLHCEAHTQP